MLFEVWQEICVKNLNRSESRRIDGKPPVYVSTVDGLENIKSQSLPGDFDINRLHYRFRRMPDGGVAVCVFANRTGVKTERLGEAVMHKIQPHMLLAWATDVAKDLLAGNTLKTGKEARAAARNLHSKMKMSGRWRLFRSVDLEKAFRHFTPVVEAPAPNFLISPVIVSATWRTIAALPQTRDSNTSAARGAPAHSRRPDAQ